MTPASFSAIIIRFISIGMLCYGVIGLISGILAHRTMSKQIAALEAMSRQSDSDASLNHSGDVFGSMLSTLYGVAGVVILVAILLYILSRRIGILLARGL